MFKKLIENKLLLTSIVSLLLVILVTIAIGYAWFTVAYDSHGGFVAPVGDFGAIYELKHNVEGESGAMTPVEEFNFNNVEQGSMHTFVLTVGAESTTESLISVYFSGVDSYTYLDETHMTNIYTNQYEKIQYAFSYNIEETFWIGYNDVNLEIEIDQKRINESIQELSDAFGWVPWTSSEKASYYTSKTVNNGVTSFDRQFFNKVLTGNTPEDYMDEYNYTLVDKVNMPGRIEDSTPEDHCAFAIIFTIMFESPCTLPSVYESPLPEFSESVYENQVIQIEHIAIQSSKKD